jgi:hypothetical protein
MVRRSRYGTAKPSPGPLTDPVRIKHLSATVTDTLESVSARRTLASNAIASVLRIVKRRSAKTENEISRLAAPL